MAGKPEFGSRATVISLGGYIAAVGIIMITMYPKEAPPGYVRVAAMLGAAMVALRCARLDVEGR